MIDPKEIAKVHLNEWNDVTGFVERDTGYYFEVLSVMEDAMQEHTAQTLDRLKEKVKQREDDLEEKINKLNLSGNPDDWILANGTEQVRMGVHNVLQLIEEVSDE